MISRTLGLEFGGSIGTLFFFANVVGCAMAIAGCTEGILNNFGPNGYFTKFLEDGAWWRFLYSSIINTSLLLVCLVGAALFAKTSVLILGTVTVCLFATFISFLVVGENNEVVSKACMCQGVPCLVIDHQNEIPVNLINIYALLSIVLKRKVLFYSATHRSLRLKALYIDKILKKCFRSWSLWPAFAAVNPN